MAAVAQCKNVMFTLNNPDIAEVDYSDHSQWPLIDTIAFITFQLERGAEGTLHLQGYMELKQKLRFNTIKQRVPLLARAHFEKRRGSQKQAIDYCRKEETRVDGPWTFGVAFNDNRGERKDLHVVKDAIKAGMTKSQVYDEYPDVAARYPRYVDTMCQEYLMSKTVRIMEVEARNEFQVVLLDMLSEDPHPREILWFYDGTGGAGKTFMSKHLVDTRGAFYTNGGRAGDITFAYNGQDVVIFDFVRDAAKYVNYGVIEQLKNGIMFSSKYESSMKRFNVPHVVVFANFLPPQGKFSRDRYAVCNVSDPDAIKTVQYVDLPLNFE